MTAAKRFGAYHRVSQGNGRDIEDESTLTDKQAWAKIDGWAAASGVEIVERYLDWDRTGSKLERPALDRMLEDLRSGVLDGAAVAKTDRLSRAKTGDALRLVGEIQEIRPGSLALLDLGVDPTTPTGEMFLTLLLGFAHMQWRQFKDSWSDAQGRAFERGARAASAPFGYRATVIGHTKAGKPIHGPLEPDPTWGPVVTEAFRIAASDGMHATQRYLSEQAPDRRWRTDDVRRLLRNRVYLGEIGLNGTVKRLHPRLTDQDTFTSAQTEPRMRRSNAHYPLSHIAQCGKCGSGLVGAFQSVHGRRYRRYRCSNPDCRGGSSISADKLEDHTLRALFEALSNHRTRVKFIPGGTDEARDALERAEAELEAYMADPELSALGKAFRAGATSRAKAVEQARGVYQERIALAGRAEVLPAAGQLHGPGQFERALAAMVDRIDVQPGRGTVESRVVHRPARPRPRTRRRDTRGVGRRSVRSLRPRRFREGTRWSWRAR